MRLVDADALKTAVDGEWCPDMMVSEIWDVIDRAPTIGGWISVKDRLPTYAELKEDCVLVLLDDGGICSTGFDECIENESIFGEWRQNFDPVTLGATDSCWMPLEGVTHWMPMPEPPEEVSGDA